MEIYHGENFSLHRNRAVLQLADAQLSQQREAEHLQRQHDNWPVTLRELGTLVETVSPRCPLV